MRVFSLKIEQVLLKNRTIEYLLLTPKLVPTGQEHKQKKVLTFMIYQLN